jgi:hypothetical protein
MFRSDVMDLNRDNGGRRSTGIYPGRITRVMLIKEVSGFIHRYGLMLREMMFEKLRNAYLAVKTCCK